jgi:hypothetical protein
MAAAHGSDPCVSGREGSTPSWGTLARFSPGGWRPAKPLSIDGSTPSRASMEGWLSGNSTGLLNRGWGLASHARSIRAPSAMEDEPARTPTALGRRMGWVTGWNSGSLSSALDREAAEVRPPARTRVGPGKG